MKINGQRLLRDLNALKQFTDTPGAGVTRFSYSENDKQARQYIDEQVKAFGGTVKVDTLQNVRIGLPSNRQGRKSVVMGSHIDTVRNGGWLDGIYGVCAGLEVLRTMAHENWEYNVELAIFAEEEGSNFGSTMTGSKFITGKYRYEDLLQLKTDQGTTMAELLGNPQSIGDVMWDFGQVKTMLELHIEQGPVLESRGQSLGIVESIFGMRVVEITLKGTGNHAGATPMDQRMDGLTTACRCILRAEEIVREDPEKVTVATVGKLAVLPGCSNVIPETVTFSLEVRDKDGKKMNAYMDRILEEVKAIAEAEAVEWRIREISYSDPLRLSDAVISRMDRLAHRGNFNYGKIDSGAVHDACMLAAHADTGMIFVPSIGGRSHVPEENTQPEDLIQGAEFLLLTVLNECGGKAENLDGE